MPYGLSNKDAVIQSMARGEILDTTIYETSARMRFPIPYGDEATALKPSRGRSSVRHETLVRRQFEASLHCNTTDICNNVVMSKTSGWRRGETSRAPIFYGSQDRVLVFIYTVTAGLSQRCTRPYKTVYISRTCSRRSTVRVEAAWAIQVKTAGGKRHGGKMLVSITTRLPTIINVDFNTPCAVTTKLAIGYRTRQVYEYDKNQLYLRRGLLSGSVKELEITQRILLVQLGHSRSLVVDTNQRAA
ncbi:hypothetical protein BDZ89DRAFT_1048362 [Hymenopellis radicata]|nr:hypothetical protein BDZ89DRAFT_1048362 [Hymenopellis radicata]